MRRPTGFVPVRGLGEWIGFLGGVLALAALVALVVVVATSDHVSIRVRNDTGSYARISGCVDDAADVDAGEEFQAEGVAEHGRLLCRVTLVRGRRRCVAVEVPAAGSGATLLSQQRAVPSGCP